MDKSRTQTKKPPVKIKGSDKNTKPPVEVINHPSAWKKFWQLVNFDWKALIATIALIFSILSYYQSKNKLKFEELKNNARDRFLEGNFPEASKYYVQVFEKNPDDVEGYWKFLNKGKKLLEQKNDKCNDDIIWFFEQAKKMTKDTTDVTNKLKQCELQIK